jgi:hypothetical protein
VKHFAHLDASSDQVVTGSIDVVNGKYQTGPRPWLARSDCLAEDDRSTRILRRYLHTSKVTRYDVNVEAPSEFFVKRLRAIDVRNTEQYNFELHVYRFSFCHHCR